MKSHQQEKSRQRTNVEVAQIRDDALRRALNTPPRPHDEMKLGKKKRKPKAAASSKK